MKNKTIIIFIVAVILIVAGFFIFNAFLKNNSDTTNTSETVNGVSVETLTPSIIVPKQAGGSNVFIENVTIDKDGYVVIHEDENGKPGAVVGVSKLLTAGTTENFLMDIDKEVVEGDSLFAMLHIDNGDQIFSIETDIPAVDSDGNTILTRFDIVNEGALDNEVKL